MRVNELHLNLLWPLQLEQLPGRKPHWLAMDALKGQGWRRKEDGFEGSPAFKERHYRAFVSFLPYVQRFLYGEGRSQSKINGAQPSDSPMHVFRREDVKQVRLKLASEAEPVTLHVEHLDLYFFEDLDLVLLKPSLSAHDLDLTLARRVLFALGRAYPSGWDAEGVGVNNAERVEWLDAQGQVLAASDTDQRPRFLEYVGQHRSPCISKHWAWLLQPLVLSHSEELGELRYRLIEYHRMPVAAYFALERPRALSRDDWIRLGLATVLRPDETLKYNDPQIAKFEQNYCYDRFWQDSDAGPNTRFISTGPFLAVVGEAGSEYFRGVERGMLAQFRYQYSVVFMIAHLHRAALLVFSDILVEAVNALDLAHKTSVRRFKRTIRVQFEVFLRFTHRYWFHELSERPPLQAMFQMSAAHLRNDELYAEVRDEVREMNYYLDTDSQRRQSNTVVRLTVITILGLIVTVTTGYFGMNIVDFADGSVLARILHGVLAVLGFTTLILLAIAKSRRLSDFLEALSDEKLTSAAKMRALRRVFG